MKYALIMLAFTSTLAHAVDVDINKFCLGKYCLNDPLNKYGPTKTIVTFDKAISASYAKNYADRINSIKNPPAPSCKAYMFEAIPDPELANILRPSITTLVYAPFPEHLKDGIGNYYRVVSITARFPKIGESEEKALIQKVFSRAGVKYEQDFLNGPRWKNPKNPMEQVSIKTVDVGDMSVTDDKSSLILRHILPSKEYSDALTNQPGCRNAAPDL